MNLNKRSYHISTATALIVAQLCTGLLGQSVSAPTTVPSTAPSTNPNLAATSRPSRSLTGVQQQNGGLTLNFQDASIDVILDELSTAAGFIVVKEVKPEGRVTLVSKQSISPEEAGFVAQHGAFNQKIRCHPARSHP